MFLMRFCGSERRSATCWERENPACRCKNPDNLVVNAQRYSCWGILRKRCDLEAVSPRLVPVSVGFRPGSSFEHCGSGRKSLGEKSMHLLNKCATGVAAVLSLAVGAFLHASMITYAPVTSSGIIISGITETNSASDGSSYYGQPTMSGNVLSFPGGTK